MLLAFVFWFEQSIEAMTYFYDWNSWPISLRVIWIRAVWR